MNIFDFVEKGYTNDLLYLREPYEIIDRPLNWQRQGLQETQSGYGARLTSARCVKLPNGIIRRIYVTQYSNAGSAWIRLGGKTVYLRG